MEEEYDLERDIDVIKDTVDMQMQVSLFHEVLDTIQQYTANTLPSTLDEDIRHSLNKVMSLRKLRNEELTILTIEYMECISKLRTVYIYSIIPYLYDLTDTDNATIKELAYSTFSNVYIYALLAAAKVMRSADRDVRDMWEKAEKMRKSLVGYYKRGGPLSLISLHFIHLLCHYFTKRDDRFLYNGKTGVVETSIQFTINDIPEGSPLFQTKDLVLDGYDYVNMIIQAFLTKASVFTFKHKVIAINSLFSIITHRKDFIPIILPLLLDYKPSNETIQYIITSNMQRVLKLPTFDEYEVKIVDYLSNVGVHEDAINRAKDQRNRIGDFLKKKKIDLIPARLSPSYSYDYKDGKDNLFDQELKRVMKNLGEDALAALPIPSLSLSTIPLSTIKLFPISILATLAIMNLQNEVQERKEEQEQPIEQEEEITLKREPSEMIGETKRRKQIEGILRPSEYLDIPARYVLMKSLVQQLIQASQNQSIHSHSYQILFDTTFALLTISDKERIFTMIEKTFNPSTSSSISQSAEEVIENHPFQEILQILKSSIPSNSSFIVLFLKRLYLRNLVYKQKCKSFNSSSASTLYSSIYQSLVLHIVNYIYKQLQTNTTKKTELEDCLSSILTTIPILPFELFPYIICNSLQSSNNEIMNSFSFSLLQKIMTTHPKYTNECFICLLFYASLLVKKPITSSSYSTEFNNLLISILSNQYLFHQFILLVTEEEDCSLHSTISKFTSFTNGILILPSIDSQSNTVKKSGMFSMTNTETLEKQSIYKNQQSLLQEIAHLDYSFALVASIKCDIEQLPVFIHYVTEKSSIQSAILQQLITQFCLPILPTIHGCVSPLNTEEIEDGQYTMYTWKEDTKDYDSLYLLVELLFDCVTINKDLVLTILRYCVRVSKISKDQDLFDLIEKMYEETHDIQFKLLIMNWLDKEEITAILKEEPIPASLHSWLVFIAEDPYPLSLVEVIVILCHHSLNKLMLECLQTCIRSEFYPIDIFIEAITYLIMEKIDGQTLSYILLSLVTGKANVEAQVCNCLVDYTQRGGFKELTKRAPFVQFISRCKDASACLLYVMSKEELELIMKEIPDTKNWLLDYFQKEGKSIPDYMTSLLYSTVCLINKSNKQITITKS